MRLSSSRTMLVALGLLILSNGPVFFVAERVLEGERGWEKPFTRQVFVATALAATAVVLLDRYRVSGRRLMRPSPPAAAALMVFVGWAVLSSAWSLAPDITRGRALIYVGLAALAWIIADLDLEEARRAVAVFAGVAIGLSLLIVAVSDSIGLDRNDDWRGIYTNRNSLAPVAGVAIILGVGNLFDARGLRRIGAALLPVAGAVVMLGSGSRTAWLAVAVAAGTATVVAAARVARDRQRPRVVAMAAGVSLAGAVATVAVVSRLWGESTFEQRRTIWSLVWERIGDRPLHGHGWFAVWGVPDFIAADPLLKRGSAHGSFLEVWLGLGVIGLIPFLAIVVLALVGAVRSVWREPSAITWSWLALVVFLLIENLTESFVLWFSYNWVLLSAAALRSGVGWPQRRESRTPEPSDAVNA